MNLAVQTYNGAGEVVTFWKFAESEANVWKQGQFPLPPLTEYWVWFQSCSWMKSKVQISWLFKIVFHIVGSPGSNGYVAIDEVELLQNPDNCGITPPEADPSYTTTTTTTTTTDSTTTTIDPDWETCTFETGLCSWEIDYSFSGDAFFWNRTNSEILESENIEGPNFDHTLHKKSEPSF